MNNPTILKIKVIPRAQKTESVGYMSDGTEKIRIKAPPEDGKANAELCRFLSERQGGNWEVKSGKSNSLKMVVRQESGS